MKKVAIACIAIALTSACSNPEVERLKTEKAALIEKVMERDQEIDDFVRDLNTISDNIRQISDREDLLVGMTIDDVELAQSSEERILDDLYLIDELILDNKALIEKLEKNLRAGKVKRQEFERLVANLKMDVIDKENNIIILKAELDELEGDYADLLSDYYDEVLTTRLQDRALHKAFYTFGTKKELVEMEVVEKVGGVLGVGSTHKLKDDFNKGYFTEVDLRELERIPIESKEVELVSNHPEGAFELVKKDNRITEIKITDKDAFWSGSRYLAMVVK